MEHKQLKHSLNLLIIRIIIVVISSIKIFKCLLNKKKLELSFEIKKASTHYSHTN